MADKTEKATPKRREEARKKGQVAKSTDLNGAIVLLAGLSAAVATGPKVVERLGAEMAAVLDLVRTPDVVTNHGLGSILLGVLQAAGLAVLPIAGACVVAGVIVNVAQVRFKPSLTALKPDPRRINPLSGFKNIFGPNSLVEGAKSVTKVTVVGVLVALALVPKVEELGAMVGVEPAFLGSALSSSAFSLARRAAIAYLVIGVIDYVWQRHRHEKSLKMDLQEVKDEAKQQQLPSEVRGQMRRRQMQAARARMMAAVPTADVVVTNPTHYAVALKYDGTRPAPEVVAKGVDLVAARIRELAREAGVPVVPDPPLARSLHASVEIGHEIPEALFGSVAQVLAFVYRMAGRRAVAARAAA
jgi:flagellar biosynthetic protein FlhB